MAFLNIVVREWRDVCDGNVARMRQTRIKNSFLHVSDNKQPQWNCPINPSSIYECDGKGSLLFTKPTCCLLRFMSCMFAKETNASMHACFLVYTANSIRNHNRRRTLQERSLRRRTARGIALPYVPVQRTTNFPNYSITTVVCFRAAAARVLSSLLLLFDRCTHTIPKPRPTLRIQAKGRRVPSSLVK